MDFLFIVTASVIAIDFQVEKSNQDPTHISEIELVYSNKKFNSLKIETNISWKI